jgi:hypothetical protein
MGCGIGVVCWEMRYVGGLVVKVKEV